MKELLKDQFIATIRKDNKTIATIESKEGKIYVSGEIGEGYYNSFVELFYNLQGFNISFDDLFF